MRNNIARAMFCGFFWLDGGGCGLDTAARGSGVVRYILASASGRALFVPFIVCIMFDRVFFVYLHTTNVRSERKYSVA